MELRWEPRVADWRDALRATNPQVRRSSWFAALLAAIAVVMLVRGYLAPAVFGLCAVLAIMAVPTLAVRASFLRNPIATTAMTGTVDDRSVRMTTADGTAHSELTWDEITLWRRTRRNYVLRTGPVGGPVYPVPRRAFVDAEDDAAFGRLLEEHCPPR